jgi:hypothetical protein
MQKSDAQLLQCSQETRLTPFSDETDIKCKYFITDVDLQPMLQDLAWALTLEARRTVVFSSV